MYLIDLLPIPITIDNKFCNPYLKSICNPYSVIFQVNRSLAIQDTADLESCMVAVKSVSKLFQLLILIFHSLSPTLDAHPAYSSNSKTSEMEEGVC